MAYDGWIEFAGTELVNVSRTAQLAESMGIDAVRIIASLTSWLNPGFGEGPFGEGPFGGGPFSDITEAPWYDSGYAPSSEFAGIIPLSFAGLDDSTLESSTIEYTTDGGHSSNQRNATLPIVANVVLVASSERGAEYGLRWMNRILRDNGPRITCAGAVLRYFRYADPLSPIAHRRDVRLTRGSSVTRKRNRSCQSLWWVTFTLTANDSFEYGEEEPQFTELGGEVTGPGVDSSGSLALTQESCPAFDYSPLYDPLFPALVPSPTAPDFLPAGWDIVEGATFDRFWVTLLPVESTFLNVVPVFTLTTTEEARMVRLSIWPIDSGVGTDIQCDPLFSVVVSYLPANQPFYIDGEQVASYVWDGSSAAVRRTDSLIYGPEAEPVQWTAFNDHEGLMVTLDIFADSGGEEGGGNVRASLSFVPKSD